MESKTVKIIDEHGIDRTANIICKLTIDDKDYVLYSIERDDENDNLFHRPRKWRCPCGAS